MNGEFERFSMCAHICAEASGGGGSCINDTVHFAHFGKRLVQTVQVFFGNELSIMYGAVEINKHDCEVICKDDGATQESCCCVAGHTEGIGGEDAIPCCSRNFEREKYRLARGETVNFLNTNEVIVAGDEGKMTCGNCRRAGASSELLNYILKILLGVVTILFENELEFVDGNGSFLTDGSEESITGGSLGESGLVIEAATSSKYNYIWIEGSRCNLFHEGHDALGVFDGDLIPNEMLAEHDDDVSRGGEIAEGCIFWAVEVIILNAPDVEEVCDAFGKFVKVGERCRLGCISRVDSLLSGVWVSVSVGRKGAAWLVATEGGRRSCGLRVTEWANEGRSVCWERGRCKSGRLRMHRCLSRAEQKSDGAGLDWAVLQSGLARLNRVLCGVLRYGDKG